jgi:hypothetical protein
VEAFVDALVDAKGVLAEASATLDGTDSAAPDSETPLAASLAAIDQLYAIELARVEHGYCLAGGRNLAVVTDSGLVIPASYRPGHNGLPRPHASGTVARMRTSYRHGRFRINSAGRVGGRVGPFWLYQTGRRSGADQDASFDDLGVVGKTFVVLSTTMVVILLVRLFFGRTVTIVAVALIGVTALALAVARLYSILRPPARPAVPVEVPPPNTQRLVVHPEYGNGVLRGHDKTTAFVDWEKGAGAPVYVPLKSLKRVG